MIYNIDKFIERDNNNNNNNDQQAIRSFISKLKPILKSCLSRLILISQILVSIYILFEYKRNYLYGLISCIAVLIIVDGYYVIFKRNGFEHKWFSFSLFLYTFTINLTIWSLWLDNEPINYTLELNESLINVIEDTQNENSFIFYVSLI